MFRVVVCESKQLALKYASLQESDDNVDIAASIKALAKSVHGSDAIFGDLPRPRLSTQI